MVVKETTHIDNYEKIVVAIILVVVVALGSFEAIVAAGSIGSIVVRGETLVVVVASSEKVDIVIVAEAGIDGEK